MHRDVASLLEQCVAAHKAGVDFPTIWRTIIEGHPLVATELPVSGPGPHMTIPLLTGDVLHFTDQFFVSAVGSPF